MLRPGESDVRAGPKSVAEPLQNHPSGARVAQWGSALASQPRGSRRHRLGHGPHITKIAAPQEIIRPQGGFQGAAMYRALQFPLRSHCPLAAPHGDVGAQPLPGEAGRGLYVGHRHGSPRSHRFFRQAEEKHRALVSLQGLQHDDSHGLASEEVSRLRGDSFAASRTPSRKDMAL